MMDGPKVRAAKSALAKAINSGTVSVHSGTLQRLYRELADARKEEAGDDA